MARKVRRRRVSKALLEQQQGPWTAVHLGFQILLCIVGFFPVGVAQRDSTVLVLLGIWCMLGFLYTVAIMIMLSHQARDTSPPTARPHSLE